MNQALNFSTPMDANGRHVAFLVELGQPKHTMSSRPSRQPVGQQDYRLMPNFPRDPEISSLDSAIRVAYGSTPMVVGCGQYVDQ